MKEYKFDLAHGENSAFFLPISDGQNFVFSFSTSDYLMSKAIGISLHLNNICTYRAVLNPPNDVDIGDWNDTVSSMMPAVGTDANIVVRIEKDFPPSYTTYINDQLIRTMCASEAGTDSHENGFDTAGIFINNGRGSVAVSLNVFEDRECGAVKAFAQAMRNFQPGDFVVEGIVGQDSEDRDRSMSTDSADGANPSSHASLSPGGTENGEGIIGTDGANSANLSSHASVRPRDADIMKLSSTVAWPKAVDHVLGCNAAGLQNRHDKSMDDWVTERGDNIPSNAYDYFVYSHGVIWPRSILEVTTDNNFLKIREKHIEILKVLKDAMNALRV